MDGLGQQEWIMRDDALRFADGIKCIQRGIAQVVEEIAMDGVRARLGDGVDLAADRLAELDGVVGDFRLEFLDGIQRVDVWRTRGAAARLGEEHLVVVRAIDVVLVVQTGDAAIGDQTGAAVLHHIRRGKHEGAPIAGIDRQIADELLPDGLRDLRLLCIDDVRLAGDLDDRGGAGCGQVCIRR